MSKVQNDSLDEQLYKAFWYKLQQTKFDIIYYSEYFNRYTKISRIIKYIIAGATVLSTGVWMNWGSVPAIANICSIVILALQVVSAMSEHFPYESRTLELRDMLAELNPLYLEMENDWRTIWGLKMSNPKIQEAIHRYELRQEEIKCHYFKTDALPDNEKIRTNADEKTEEYFKYFV